MGYFITGYVQFFAEIEALKKVHFLTPRPKKTVFQGNSIEFENSQKILKVLFSKEVRE